MAATRKKRKPGPKKNQMTAAKHSKKSGQAKDEKKPPMDNPFDVTLAETFGPTARLLFLQRLCADPRIPNVARQLNIPQGLVHGYMKKDKDFAAAAKEIIDGRIGMLEDEAFRRATEGVEEPIHYQGELVTTVTKYSDTLAMFLLKGNKPETYGANRTGDDNQPVKFTINFGAGVGDD